MRNHIVDTDFDHICRGQRPRKYQHTSHNVKNHPYAVLLSVNKDAMDGDLKTSLRMTHIFVMYNEISTRNFKEGIKSRLKGNDSGNPSNESLFTFSWSCIAKPKGRESDFFT